VAYGTSVGPRTHRLDGGSCNVYAGGDRTAGATWADAALDYAALLPGHMAKENQILFVMAERLLSTDE
jgi:hemerythrin-like domain-containing protein